MASPTSHFDEFLELSTEVLKGESFQFLALIKKRYAACSEHFRNSPEMETLLQTTATKLRTDGKRMFVHLKDFVTELKAWAADGANQSSRKRKAENRLQAVAKAARLEESTSDSSDVEGKLKRAIGANSNRTALLKSVNQNKAPSSGMNNTLSGSSSKVTSSTDVAGPSAVGQLVQRTPLSSDAKSPGNTESESETGHQPNHQQSELCTKEGSSDGSGDIPAHDAGVETGHDTSAEQGKKEILLVLGLCQKNVKSTEPKGDTADSISAAHSAAAAADRHVAETQGAAKGCETQGNKSKKLVKLNSVVDKLKSRCSSTFTSNPNLPSTSSAHGNSTALRPACNGEKAKTSNGRENSDGVSDDNEICVTKLDNEPLGDVVAHEKISAKKTNEKKVPVTGVGIGTEEEDRSHIRTDRKSEKHVRRLERLLEDIRDKIEKIRETDLTLDDLDSENSAYIFEDRLQKKFVKVWNKLCLLKGRTTSSGRPVERHFKYEGSRYPEINRRIECFVNRRKIFPDFHDIKGIVQKVNTQSKLGLNAQQVNNISREAFLDVGEALQKRRHEDFIDTFHSRQTMSFRRDQDPANFDVELSKKLDQNRQLGKTRLDEVIGKYTDLQYQMGENEEEEERTDASYEEKNHDSLPEIPANSDLPEKEMQQQEDDEGEYGCDIEVDVDESYHRLEGEPLSQDFLETGSRTSEGPSSLVPDQDSRNSLNSEPTATTSNDNLADSSNGTECLGADVDVSKTQPAVTDSGEAQRSGNVSRNDTLGSGRLRISAAGDRSSALGNRTDRTSENGAALLINIARNKSGSGVKPNTSKSSTAPLLSIVRNEVDNNVRPSTSKGNAPLSVNRFSGTFPSTHSSSPRFTVATMPLKNPISTKPNSKSPLKVFTRMIKVPHTLVKKRVNGQGDCSQGNLYYPGKANSAVTYVKKDSNGCLVISSSDEDEEDASREVAKHDPPSQLIQAVKAEMNGMTVGSVKKEPLFGDDDDVVTISD